MVKKLSKEEEKKEEKRYLFKKQLKTVKKASKKEEVRHVLKNGLFFSENGITLKLAKKKSIEEKTDATVVVGKKAVKRAVDRNKIKRLIKEATKVNVNNIKSGYTLIFLYKGSFSDNFHEIKGKVENLLKKADLLK